MKFKKSLKIKLSKPILIVLFILAVSGCFLLYSHYFLYSYKCSGCNVILISIDTLRADHLGFMGYKNITPNLDRLSDKSIVYDNAISQFTWTFPSHVSMFSSLYPYVDNVTSKKDNTDRISNKITLLAEILKSNGYVTEGNTEGGFVSSVFGFNRGFDSYNTDPAQEAIDKSVSFIKQNNNNKFFLFFHTYLVHSSYFTGRDSDKYVAKLLNLQVYSPTEKEIGQLIDKYDLSIEEIDSLLGNVFEELEMAKITDKTIIIFTSDHGESFFEHGFIGHGNTPYQELIHVPLLIYNPRQGRPKRVSGYVETLDIMPTLLEILGINPGIGLQGLDLFKNKEHDTIESFGLGYQASIIDRASNLKRVVDAKNKAIVNCSGELIEEGQYLKNKLNITDLSMLYWTVDNYLSKISVSASSNYTFLEHNVDFESDPDKFTGENFNNINAFISYFLENCTISNNSSSEIKYYNLTKDPKEREPMYNEDIDPDIFKNEKRISSGGSRQKKVLLPPYVVEQLKSLGYV